MRFSRHAKNEMRLYRLSREDVESAVMELESVEPDERGNQRLLGRAEDGRLILVVIAGDDPEFVITVFLRS